MTPPLGLIEGFFGRPWRWQDRRGAISALAAHGYRFYLYAPKADPYLRRRWQEPYPERELEDLAAFAKFCRTEGVRFGIGLSPFELHLHPEAGWQDRLARKLAELDQLKPDDLAILFDDMRGDVPDLAERQAAIVHYAAERSAARRIICCPSYYTDDPILDIAFGERPPFYLEQLGRLLDPAIEIMWTGEEVCAREFSPGHLARVAHQLGRKPFLCLARHPEEGSYQQEGEETRLSADGVRAFAESVAHRLPGGAVLAWRRVEARLGHEYPQQERQRHHQ
jgi:hypothetical protein